jgi:hypothetical protein
VLTGAIELELEFEARRLDESLREAGYSVNRRHRWPREAAPVGQQVMRRGPWCWGEKVAVRIR